MNKDTNLKKEIKDYLVESSMSPSDKILEDTLIFDTGILDSMGLLFLIEFINEKYGISVSDDELIPSNFESINNIAEFINKKL